MSKQIDALKLALEALEFVNKSDDDCDFMNFECAARVEDAITAIKEALEHTEQDKERCVGCEACIDTACGRDECPKGWPKAEQPEQRKPLTDEQLMIALLHVDADAKRLPIGFRAFARAIEAAHGIKE